MTQKSYVSSHPRPRTLAEIADEIADDFDPCGADVTDILDSLKLAETIHDPVHERKAGDLVRDFLKLSADWQGNTARRVKHELRGKLGFA